MDLLYAQVDIGFTKLLHFSASHNNNKMCASKPGRAMQKLSECELLGKGYFGYRKQNCALNELLGCLNQFEKFFFLMEDGPSLTSAIQEKRKSTFPFQLTSNSIA